MYLWNRLEEFSCVSCFLRNHWKNSLSRKALVNHLVKEIWRCFSCTLFVQHGTEMTTEWSKIVSKDCHEKRCSHVVNYYLGVTVVSQFKTSVRKDGMWTEYLITIKQIRKQRALPLLHMHHRSCWCNSCYLCGSSRSLVSSLTEDFCYFPHYSLTDSVIVPEIRSGRLLPDPSYSIILLFALLYKLSYWGVVTRLIY